MQEPGPDSPDDFSHTYAQPLPNAVPAERGHHRHWVIWMALIAAIIIAVAVLATYNLKF